MSEFWAMNGYAVGLKILQISCRTTWELARGFDVMNCNIFFTYRFDNFHP